MSAFKGDQNYSAHYYDSPPDVESDKWFESSDEEEPLVRGVTARWVLQYQDALDELYGEFLRVGKALFGSAFHQTGTYGSFTRYVYSAIQPSVN